jgi:hypothetical protein
MTTLKSAHWQALAALVHIGARPPDHPIQIINNLDDASTEESSTSCRIVFSFQTR